MGENIRKAKKEDLERITEIYNQSIKKGNLTGDLKTYETSERLPWFNLHLNERFPIFVYENEGYVVGYAYLSVYRGGRGAFEDVAEISYYIDFEFHGNNIGSKLIQHSLEFAKESGFHSIVAILLKINKKSIGLLNKFGFEKWGELPEVANLHGKFVNHLYYGKKL